MRINQLNNCGHIDLKYTHQRPQNARKLGIFILPKAADDGTTTPSYYIREPARSLANTRPRGNFSAVERLVPCL
jgi:hypothetical protein